MQIRDCLQIDREYLNQVTAAPWQFYDGGLREVIAQQVLIPDHPSDGLAGLLCALFSDDTEVSNRLLLCQGGHSAGKSTVLFAAACLLAGPGLDAYPIVSEKLKTALPETAQELKPMLSIPRVVLAVDAGEAKRAGFTSALLGAASQALEMVGTAPLSDSAVAAQVPETLASVQKAMDCTGKPVILIDNLDALFAGPTSKSDLDALHILFQAAEGGSVQVIAFSQRSGPELLLGLTRPQQTALGALNRERIFRLHCCVELLLHEMIRQTDTELYSQNVGRFVRQKDHYFYTHFCQLRRWGKQVPISNLWQDYNLFLTHITLDCYPLHPFMVYMMTLISPLLSTRPITEIAADVLENSLDQEFVRVWPPFVYPAALLDDGVCQDLLLAEQQGLIKGHLLSDFTNLYAKIGDQLAPYEDAVLKAVLLLLLCNLEYVDKTDLTEIISKCTGIYKSEEIDSAFTALEDEYGAISYDSAKNEIVIHSEPCGRKDYERQRSRALLRCGRLNCVRDCDEYLLSKLQLNLPVDTTFAQQKGISSSEWQWDKEFVHITALTREELSVWKKTISTRHNVAEHRGLLVYLYCPEDSDAEQKQVCAWYKELKLSECAIELMFLVDSDNRFRNGVRDWNILKRFTLPEQERFRRYYDDGVRGAENLVIGAFHQMTRELLFAKDNGPIAVSDRVDVYCTNRFMELFCKAPSFQFEGFERKLTNQIRNNYVSVVTKLMDDTITNPRGYQSLSEGLRTRINNCFQVGMPKSWQVLNKNCELVEPLNPEILEIFLMAEDDLLGGSLTVGRLFRSKLYAPYGMNEYSLGLLICLFMVYNRNRLEITSNGVHLRPENVVSLFILKTKIRFSELFSMKLSLKTMSEEKEVLHACDEVASNRYVENCSNLRDWLQGLMTSQTLSEAVEERVNRAVERLDQGQALYDQLYHNTIDHYLSDMNSDKPAVRCLAAARIQDDFSDLEGEIAPGSGYYYSPQFARVLGSMKSKGDTLLNRFFHGELAKLDCTVAFWDRFRKQYMELAEALVKCGRMDETYQLLQRLSDIEKKVGNMKADAAEQTDPAKQ